MIILNSFSNILLDVLIRQAKDSDKNTVLDFCRSTFSWGDYINDVWDYWILEGNLLVLTENDIPVALCHSSFFENQVWIEGIRVNDKFRRKGLAKKLVLESEALAKKQNCKISKMLIATNNDKSLSLANKLNYKKESIWNFFNLIPKKIKKNMNIITANNEKIIVDFLLEHLSSYVKSWRWIPLSKKNLELLFNEKRILYNIHEEKIDTMIIFTESEHFDKTLMITLIYGTDSGTKQMLEYIQNFAVNNNFKRIQILTEIKNLPKIEKLEERFSFCLMKKVL